MGVPPSGDPAAALLQDLVPADSEDIACDVLVVGGGTGGVAATLAAVRAGRTVCLIEETDWIGGQLTAQGVSALDEHEYIEQFGGTRTYYALREEIRDHYRRISPSLADQPHPNPGACWVTRLAFEPRVALKILESWVEPLVAAGRLRLFRRTKGAAVETTGDRITRLHALHLDGRQWWAFYPGIVIDATELGDILPLAGAEHMVGAESRAQTGEPHAQPHGPKAHCVRYPIDIHRAGPDDVGVSCRTRPFQIPMGALIPIRLRNLLAGAKNLGVTHITNGCYRLHPVEWNIGEAAGALAAFALETKRDPADVWRDPAARVEFQRRLAAAGVPLYWFIDVGVEHPAFAALQIAAVTDEVEGAPDSLEAVALPAAVRGRYGL